MTEGKKQTKWGTLWQLYANAQPCHSTSTKWITLKVRKLSRLLKQQQFSKAHLFASSGGISNFSWAKGKILLTSVCFRAYVHTIQCRLCSFISERKQWMHEWRLCACFLCGMVGGFQTHKHYSGTEDPILTLQSSTTVHAWAKYTHAWTNTHAHTPHFCGPI